MELEERTGSGAAKTGRLLGALVKAVLAIGILLGAFAVAKYQMDTSRTAEQHQASRQAKVVEVVKVQHADVQTVVHAMGTVVPAQAVTLMPQVSGQVVSLDPGVVPGGLARAGETLLEIDTRDYEFAIQQRRDTVAQARLDLLLEQGNQAVARAEYHLLGEMISEQDRELVLREPHLNRAEASWQSAQAALAQAELNRDRCFIRAPFNGIIRDKQVDQGATVSSSTPLLTLIGTDACWIEATVRWDELKWVQFPKDTMAGGSLVRVFDKSQWDPDVYREGSVIRLLPDLETHGRLACLLIRVPDPFSLGSKDLPRLLMGSYVRVEIAGRTLDSVIPVARDHLHSGDTVWLMNPENRLEMRSVEIAFRDKHRVYVSHGLEAAERLVVTSIGTPVEDMLLELASSQPGDMPSAESQEGDPL